MLNVEKKIENKEIISFDLYDTLVNRLIEDEMRRFQTLEDEYNRLHKVSIAEFAHKRIDAERYLRTKKCKRITIGKIYEGIVGLSEEQKNDLIKLEEELEIRISYANSKGWALFHLAKQLNKRIIIISDMYLHRNTLVNMLKKCGYDGFEKIFVSGEEGESKSDYGQLFDLVCDSMNVSHTEVLHIGDNWRSDWVNTFIKGIRNIKILPDKRNEILKFVDHKCDIDSDSLYHDIGYKFFAPLVVGYCKWIHDRCIEKNIKKIYFFSREGRLLKKVYELYFNDIEIEYLYVSRQALTLPLVKKCKNLEELLRLCSLKSGATVEVLLERLCIKSDELTKSLKEKNYRLSDVVSNVRDRDLFFSLIVDKAYQMSNSQYDYCKSYFKSVGLLDLEDDSCVGIVDVGWEGNMQKCFVSILKQYGCRAKVEGFFVGQKTAMKEHISQGMYNTGFLYNYDEINDIRMMINSSETLLEVMLFANHGTTLGYSQDGPVLKEIEYSDEVVNKLLEVTNGILEFAQDIYEVQYNYSIITRQEIIATYGQLAVKLPKIYVEKIADWEFLNDGNSKIVERVAPVHLKRFLIEFRHCGWKTAYLKLNTKISLPFFKAYKFAETMRIRRKL